MCPGVVDAERLRLVAEEWVEERPEPGVDREP
jgi:hypothetical protein